MAGIEPLILTSDLKTNLLANAKANSQPLVAHYDSLSDNLILQIVPLEVETVVHYIDDQVALIFQDEDLEIVGMQIEDFVHSFLPDHDNVMRLWQSHLKDFGSLFVTAEEMSPETAQEVIRAAGDMLGDMGPKLIDAIA